MTYFLVFIVALVLYVVMIAKGSEAKRFKKLYKKINGRDYYIDIEGVKHTDADDMYHAYMRDTDFVYAIEDIEEFLRKKR